MSEDIDDYWGDVSDHLGRTLDSLEELSEILATLSDAHDKLVSQRMNDIIKTLTIFTVIMLPLTVITGVFGMNVPLPAAGRWITTGLILFLLLALSLGMFEYFRRKQWL
jgi:magnesium transporter